MKTPCRVNDRTSNKTVLLGIRLFHYYELCISTYVSQILHVSAHMFLKFCVFLHYFAIQWPSLALNHEKFSSWVLSLPVEYRYSYCFTNRNKAFKPLDYISIQLFTFYPFLKYNIYHATFRIIRFTYPFNTSRFSERIKEDTRRFAYDHILP